MYLSLCFLLFIPLALLLLKTKKQQINSDSHRLPRDRICIKMCICIFWSRCSLSVEVGLTSTLSGSETKEPSANDLTGLTSITRLGRREQRVRFKDRNTILRRHHSMPPKGRRLLALPYTLQECGRLQDPRWGTGSGASPSLRGK